MSKIKLNKDRAAAVVNSNQDFKLKDGRRIFTTNNNFKHWLEDNKGNVIPITEEYFRKALKLV